MSPQAADRVCLPIAVLLPIPLILRWDRLGVLLGTVVVWGSLILVGLLLSKLDPSRGTIMLDPISSLFGWVGGLLDCLPNYGAKPV